MVIPKTDWGDGPWQSEPDEASWTDAATGLPCRAERNFGGAWCGYVGVPREHPAFGLSYYVRLDDPPEPAEEAEDDFTRYYREKSRDDWELAQAHRPAQQFINHIGVHGGLTFAGDRDADPGLHWFGFDCGHGGDLRPAMEVVMRHIGPPPPGWREVYRTLDYVREQCAGLARQLADIAATIATTHVTRSCH
jgi:hypothetical protein